MSLWLSTGREGKRLPQSRVARSTVRTGCHSPVAELLGVLRSLSVAFQSCPVHLAACLMASCLCRGQQRGQRAMGHLWAVPSAHVLSGEPCRRPALGHPLAPVLQPHMAVVSGRCPPPRRPQQLCCQQQGANADPAERQPRRQRSLLLLCSQCCWLCLQPEQLHAEYHR